jgi:hypothetical protein
VKSAAADFNVTVPAGVYVWAFIKSLFATTQISTPSAINEVSNRLQTRATVGTIVVNTPITMTALVPTGGVDLGIRVSA